ncbi:MAG: ABC transporter permease subunit, partial [Thermodesulfobacteriota bacterium]
MTLKQSHRTTHHILALLVTTFLLLGSVSSTHADGSDTFKVALTGKYPPFSMYDNRGELAGFDVDVSREVARRLNRDLVLIPTEWDGILSGLLSGKYDAIIGSMAITKERSRMVDFSAPYYESGAQLFVHRNLSGRIGSIHECLGERIGVVLGETYEHYLRKNYPGIETVTYKSTVDIFRDVMDGRLAGFVSDRLLGAYQIKHESLPFITAGPLLYRERMGIPVVKDRPDLLGKINRALGEMKEDGTLEGIHDRWFGLGKSVSGTAEGEVAMEAATVARLLGYGFAVTLVIAVISIILGFILAVPEGLILNSSTVPGRWLLRAFNDFIRGTPVLIQLFFVYFGLTAWISIRFNIEISSYSAAVFTLSINASAYMAEVVRS